MWLLHCFPDADPDIKNQRRLSAVHWIELFLLFSCLTLGTIKLTCRYGAQRNSGQVEHHVGQNGISRLLPLVLLAPRGVTVQERNRTGDKDNLHPIHRLL